MLHNRFFLWFALSATCFSLASSNGYSLAAIFEQSSYSFELAQADLDNSSDKATVTTENLTYEQYMAAGYQADQNRDYPTALKHFHKALALRPQDSFAERAIINITSYAFDRYMQAGYAADRSKNYQVALDNFQKARQIKPDSVYAQTAINNMQKYLVASFESSEQNYLIASSQSHEQNYLIANSQSSEQQSTDSQNLLLMIAGLIATALVGVGVLFLLLKKGDTPPEESVEENLNSNSFSSEEKIMTASESQVGSNHHDILPTTNINTNQVNTNQVEQSSGMLVTPSSSISKLDIVPELIEDLNTRDRTLRRKTIWELAQRADSRAMKPLVELMMDVDSQERSLILEAMTQIASRTLKPMNKALMLSLEDENSQVKQNAIRDLTRVYDLMSQVTKRLSQAVEDSDSQVQETAKWALQQLNQMPEIPWQMTAMEDNKDSTNRV